MSGDPAGAARGEREGDGDGDPAGAARRATVRTTHDAPAVVAAALTPDHTDEMATRVEGEQVVTTIERPTTGGLRSTLDDYVVNVSVAERTVQHANRHATTDT